MIYTALMASLNEGDEVIIPAPYWVSYPDMVLANDGTPVIVPCGEDSGFKLTPEALRAAITPSTKWLILNAPSNPTGAVYTRSELEDLGAVLLEQPFRDTEQTVRDLVTDAIATMGENIQVRRFERYALGEDL